MAIGSNHLSSIWTRLNQKKGFSLLWQAVIFLATALLIFSRRPDAFLRPQFYAEDGVLWYGDAYRFGWIHALAAPSGGYLNTLQRLIGAIAQLVPIHSAPAVMNLCGLVLQILPVTLLLSKRCAGWGPLPVRILQAIAYVALPKSSEINITVTNSHFHYALLVCLLAFAEPPAHLISRLVDIFAFAVAGVSGPFAVALLPLIFFFWWCRRQPWYLIIFFALAISSVIQMIELTHQTSRPQTPLGASFELFTRLLSGQVYLGTILGLHGRPTYAPFLELAVVAIAGTSLLIYCLAESRLELKLTLIFCYLIFAAALKSPLFGGTESRWLILRDASEIRYWFFPMLGFSWALIWCSLEARMQLIRALAAIALLFAVRGMTRSWRYPAYWDVHFVEAARQFEKLAPGQLGELPIFPNWVMRLNRHGPGCSLEPYGVVEAPQPNAAVSANLLVSGTAMAARPIVSVSLLLDGQLVEKFPPFIPRPVEDAAYPSLPNQNKGWQHSVDAAKLSPGKHQLVVQATTDRGCTAVLGDIPIEKVL